MESIGLNTLLLLLFPTISLKKTCFLKGDRFLSLMTRKASGNVVWYSTQNPRQPRPITDAKYQATSSDNRRKGPVKLSADMSSRALICQLQTMLNLKTTTQRRSVVYIFINQCLHRAPMSQCLHRGPILALRLKEETQPTFALTIKYNETNGFRH